MSSRMSLKRVCSSRHWHLLRQRLLDSRVHFASILQLPAQTGHNSGPQTSLEMNVYREDRDPDWEERHIQAVRHLRLQDHSTITASSSESETEASSIYNFLHRSLGEKGTRGDLQAEEVNSSDSELEDLRLFGVLRDSATEATIVNDFQVTEVNSSDSEYEDPRLFDIVHESSREVTALDGGQITEVYDEEFEDPRLFQFIFDDTPSHESPKESRISQQVTEAPVEKHMWPCVVCVERTPDTLFTPCLHSVCCQECADHVKNRGGCPVCSSTIEIVDRIYYTQATCVVCMDSTPVAVFKPCCHAVCCEDCSNTILFGEELDIECKCPVCNAYIEDADLVRLAYS